MRARPLADPEYRLAGALDRFHGEGAMNLEQLDGFFAALICGPDPVHPSEYLPEIWGGDMADEEAFRAGSSSRLSGSRDAPLEWHCRYLAVRRCVSAVAA